MNVLSGFDGLSAGRLAFNRAGIKISKYYRSEINKFANKVATHHFPNDVQLGDITKWREWDIDWSSIDMLIGGSPCQGFSFAGKQAGTLASVNGEMVIVATREKYLELKARKEKLEDITFLSESYLFWEYVLILDHIKLHNPKVKFLLENVRMRKELLKMIDEALGVESIVINSSLVSAQNRVRHYWCNWEVTQPEDKGILLKDILEPGATADRDKSLTVTTRIAGATAKRYLEKSMHQMAIVSGGAIRGRYNSDGTTQQHLECNNQEKTNALTTVQKDNVVIFRPCEPKDNINSEGAEIKYRKLTPTECARLQTFPDGWAEQVVSNSQAYKGYGNSWTVDVIVHLFSFLNKP